MDGVYTGTNPFKHKFDMQLGLKKFEVSYLELWEEDHLCEFEIRILRLCNLEADIKPILGLCYCPYSMHSFA